MRALAFRGLVVAFAALLAASASGCSSDSDGLAREPVWGTVTFDGQPLERGTITFVPEGETPTQGGATIAGGKYSIVKDEGLVAGNYRVAISSPQGGAETIEDTTNDAPGMPPKPRKDLIPARYNSKSTLTAEVKAGASNALNFDMEKGVAQEEKAPAKAGRRAARK